MRCPFCERDEHRRALHAHLAADHADRVTTEAKTGRALVLSYQVACPRCTFSVRRIVNPRGQDPRFLDENAGEIRLVAFDQLLYHMETAHADVPARPAEEA
jgi:hypothetical protein